MRDLAALLLAIAALIGAMAAFVRAFRMLVAELKKKPLMLQCGNIDCTAQ